MRFEVHVHHTNQGEFVAECDQVGAQGRGLSRTAALDQLRDEIRYRVELCPCSGVEEHWIELDVADHG